MKSFSILSLTANVSLALLLLIPGSFSRHARAQSLPYTGVNLAGGEFYNPVDVHNPIYGKQFTYPTDAEFDYFTHKGMNIIRFPFLWETLQPVAKQPFRQAEVERLQDAVKRATAHHLSVLLDPHNYARYFGKVVGSPEVGYDVFGDFWARLATVFRNDKHVWFGLVNEPHDMPTEQWVEAANTAIAAIRKANAHNLILVPGNGYTGAFGWTQTWYGKPNALCMLDIKDPANNYVIEAHQYLDADGSGTHPAVVSPTIGSERLQQFTQWCREHHKRAFLGEFAVPASEVGQQAISDMLKFMHSNKDVWIGFTWWAAGAWWGDYMFTLEPKEGQDRPQMAYLQPFLQGGTGK